MMKFTPLLQKGCMQDNLNHELRDEMARKDELDNASCMKEHSAYSECRCDPRGDQMQYQIHRHEIVWKAWRK